MTDGVAAEVRGYNGYRHVSTAPVLLHRNTLPLTYLTISFLPASQSTASGFVRLPQ